MSHVVPAAAVALGWRECSGPLAATDIHGKTLALARLAACSIQDSLASTAQLPSQVPGPCFVSLLEGRGLLTLLLPTASEPGPTLCCSRQPMAQLKH